MDYKLRTYLHTPLYLSGDHYEMGAQLGKLTKEKLQGSEGARRSHRVDRPDTWPAPEDYTPENYEIKEPERYAQWLALIKSLPQWMVEEMRGVADGADISLYSVFSDTAHFPMLFGNSVPLTEDCSGFIANGKATKDARTMIGGNSEGSLLGRSRMNVYFRNNPDGMNFIIAHSNPGNIGGRAGVNEKGLAIWGNGIRCLTEEYGYVGYDHHITRRTVLETCSNVEEAIACLKKQKKLGGSRIFLADLERVALFEYTSKHEAVLEPEKGYQAGGSPSFVIPEMKQYNYVISDETDPNWSYGIAAKKTPFLEERYHELLAERYGKLTPEMVPEICGDHGGRGTGIIKNTMDGASLQGSDYTICVHGRKIKDTYHASSFGVLLVPDERKMYISWGSPCQAEYVGFHVPE